MYDHELPAKENSFYYIFGVVTSPVVGFVGLTGLFLSVSTRAGEEEEEEEEFNTSGNWGCDLIVWVVNLQGLEYMVSVGG